MACMFIGLGIGMMFGESGAGVIFGMGVGFLLSSFIKVEKEVSVKVPRSLGGAALILIGFAFILLGFQVLGALPQQIIQYAGGLALIGLGALVLIGAAAFMKKRSA